MVIAALAIVLAGSAWAAPANYSGAAANPGGGTPIKIAQTAPAPVSGSQVKVGQDVDTTSPAPQSVGVQQDDPPTPAPKPASPANTAPAAKKTATPAISQAELVRLANEPKINPAGVIARNGSNVIPPAVSIDYFETGHSELNNTQLNSLEWLRDFLVQQNGAYMAELQGEASMELPVRGGCTWTNGYSQFRQGISPSLGNTETNPQVCNGRLGLGRAVSVYNWLVSNGVPSDLVDIENDGVGSFNLHASNYDRQRVVVRLVKLSDQAPPIAQAAPQEGQQIQKVTAGPATTPAAQQAPAGIFQPVQTAPQAIKGTEYFGYDASM